MTASRWTSIYLTIAAVLAAILGLLVWAVPAEEGVKDWTGQLIPGGWMAWTFPVALFFFIIASLLITFTLLAIRWPDAFLLDTVIHGGGWFVFEAWISPRLSAPTTRACSTAPVATIDQPTLSE